MARRLDTGTLRVERSPDLLVARSRAAGGLRQIAPSYERLTFDKMIATRPRHDDRETALPQAELCGPGHPLFDALVDFVIERTSPEVAKGTVFFNPDASDPVVLRFLMGDVVDGNGEIVRRTLAMAEVSADGVARAARRRSLFDLVPPTRDLPTAPEQVSPSAMPADPELVMWARQHLFEKGFQHARGEREHVAAVQEDFLRRSFNALLAAADGAIAAEEEVDRRTQGAEGRLRKAELVKKQHELRRQARLAETAQSRSVARGEVSVIGSALLLPLPTAEQRGGQSPTGQGLASEEIEQIAVRVARHYEVGRGAEVVSVEDDNVGFDLLSTRHGERRCIEVKGRAGVQRVELTWSEFAKSQELEDDYWLYVVMDCAQTDPRLYRVQNPARALAGAWRPSLDVRYGVDPEPVMEAAEGG